MKLLADFTDEEIEILKTSLVVSYVPLRAFQTHAEDRLWALYKKLEETENMTKASRRKGGKNHENK
jgi:hypothetical protein